MCDNVAAVLHGKNDIRVEKWPMPEINDYEVLLEISCVGICGSDLKLYSSGKCGFDALEQPIVIGHEGAGIVKKVGSKVSTLKPGDRVAIEPTQPCRACQLCKRGRYNLCPTPGYCSSAGVHGNLCRYYKHVADFCHKIPDNLSMEEGAAVQPLAIALHACNRAGIKVGDKVAILGAGPIGILCAQSARAMGATSIVITDVIPSRLTTASELCQVSTVLTGRQEPDEIIVKKISEELGDQPDVTIDACGFAQAQRVALKVTKTGGTVLVVGIGEDKVEVPLMPALIREVDVKGSFRISNTYPAALAALSTGVISLKNFITHHLPLSETKQALELAKKGEAMKIIIHVQN